MVWKPGSRVDGEFPTRDHHTNLFPELWSIYKNSLSSQEGPKVNAMKYIQNQTTKLSFIINNAFSSGSVLVETNRFVATVFY